MPLEKPEEILKTIASGHSQVYLVKDHSANQSSASSASDNVLVCKRVETFTIIAPHDIRREIQLLTRLHHPNVSSL